MTAYGGVIGVLKAEGWIKTAIFIFASPLIGMVLGFFIMLSIIWIVRKWSPARVSAVFRKGQLLSAAMYSLGHGGADAQKTMGIIAAVLVAANLNATAGKSIPLWVVLSCHAAMGIGTLTGGWRIVHTMGSRITKLRPVSGFCAETGGALAITLVTHYGIPVSTTHTITGSIVGVGATTRLSAVRWGIARRIVWAWLITIPAAGIMAALAYYGLSAIISR